MVFKGLFDRFGKKVTATTDQPVSGDDGWVELTAGKLAVHDPVADGRYATITPEGCVRLYVNGEAVGEPTAVTAADNIRFEVDADPVRFFEVQVAEDSMTASMVLTADPVKIPDVVAVVGRHQVRLQPDYSPRARTRPFGPKQLILEYLLNQGLVRGIDETAIDRELAERTGQSVVIARGQEAQPPVAGQWVWRLDELSIAEAGQVIAEYTGEQPNKERVTVRGERAKVYEDVPPPQGFLAGNGTRIVPGGRLVASASGRARAVAAPQGNRVHIFPARKLDGDLEGEIDVQSDLIVTGSVRRARITSIGEVLILGNAENADVRAEVITVRGTATESQLATVQPGHFAILRSELAWIMTRLASFREILQQNKKITDDAFRDLQNFVRGLRRRVEALSINHPDFQPVLEDLTKVFMGQGGLVALDLGTVGRLILALTRVTKTADQTAQAGRDIRVSAAANCTLWAGRDIIIQEQAAGSKLYAGSSIRTETASTPLTQCELTAGNEICVGVLGSSKASGVVILRSAAKFEVEEAAIGTTFEFGGEHKVMEQTVTKLAAQVNAKGQLLFRQRD